MPERTVEQTAEKAQEAFWSVVASAYPEIKTGDWPPDASHEFSSACEKAVERWLMFNRDE